MPTKTTTGTRLIYRYFHVESGICITESEAKRLPYGQVIVETIRIPGNDNGSHRMPLRNARPALEKKSTAAALPGHIKPAITKAFNWLSSQFNRWREGKKEHATLVQQFPLIAVHDTSTQ